MPIIIAPDLVPTQQYGGNIRPYVPCTSDMTTNPLDEQEREPTTKEVLAHVLQLWGFDTPEFPIETVQRELRSLIDIIELYQAPGEPVIGEIPY